MKERDKAPASTDTIILTSSPSSNLCMIVGSSNALSPVMILFIPKSIPTLRKEASLPDFSRN